MTTVTARTVIGLSSFVVCLLLDVLYFPRHTIFPDEQRYIASAVGLIQDGYFSVYGARAWEMPGTAVFITPFVFLFGPEGAVVPIRMAQALLFAVQSQMIGALATRLFRDRLTGVVATAICAFYPFFLYYQGLVLSETLFNTILVLSVTSLFWWRDKGANIDRTLFAVCALFALATYVKATLTVLPPFLILAACYKSHTRLRIFIISGIIYSAALMPWWTRNHILLDSFVPFTTSATMNLYLGNNPYNLNGGADWASDTDQQTVRDLQSISSEIERHKAFGDAAISYILEAPYSFIQRSISKAYRFWNLFPNAPEFSTLLYKVVTFASFTPVLIFAVFGVAKAFQRSYNVYPLLLLFGYFTVMHMVTIASLRYRLPIEPFLIALASFQITSLVSSFITRERFSEAC